MSTSSLARACLVVALVFSQTLYAGHTMLHDNGGPAHCQICLHTPAGNAMLPGFETGPVIEYLHQHPVCQLLAPLFSSSLTDSHPARGPPPFPV